MSRARDAVSAIRKIVLIEDRMEALTSQVKHLAEGSAGKAQSRKDKKKMS